MVARPCHRIALPPGVARPRHHEGALVGQQLAQPIIGRARVLHAVDVVDLGMRRGAGHEAVAVDAVHHVRRHRLGRRVEDRRFVHVVPSARDAHLHLIGEQSAVPVAHLRFGEIREHRRTRPHRPDIDRAVGTVDEGVALDALVIGAVALLGRLRDVQVGDRHHLEPVALQVGQQPLHIGERLAIDGEGSVAILPVDVEPQHVGGHALLPQPGSDAAQFVRRHVAVARLLIAQRPLRHERRLAGQVGVAADHLCRGRAGDQIIVNGSIRRTEGQPRVVAMPEIEPGARRIVEEQAIAAPHSANADEERD